MASPLLEGLRDAALRCCEDEGSEEEEASARQEFVDVLSSPLYDVELRKASATEWLAQCEQVLQQAVELLEPSTSSGLELCEKLGLELPRVVVKFVTLSQACQDYCLSIIEDLAENCSPREMFAAFMEALHMYTTSQSLIYCIPLVQGLSLVFSRLQRWHAQFFQEASSGLLALVRLAAQDDVDDHGEDEEGDEQSIQINMVPLKQVRAALVDDILLVAQVVREACDVANDDEHHEDFQQRLGLFALQILGIVGEKIAHPRTEVPPAVLELVELLPFCGLSVFLLLTGDQIEALIEATSDDEASVDEATTTNQKKLEATKGAALAVYLALSNSQVAEVAEISLSSLKEGLHFTGWKGVVAALSVVASLFAGQPLNPIVGLALVGTILDLASSLELSHDDDEDDDEDDDDEDDDGLDVILHILPILQGLQNVVVYASKIETRCQGYDSFQKIIKDVLPETMRLQCLQMLINNCIYPSLVSLHLTCMKDEVARAWPSQPKSCTSPFVSEEVLEVIGSVLRPNDKAPDLPAQIDPVQNALNLYRFILIRESSGKTNYTRVLSEETLKMAHTKWLLPLHELVEQLNLELLSEDDEVSSDMSLALASLQSILYRCLELNEVAITSL